MKGYWFFLACAALCGSSFAIGVPAVLILLFHLIWLRILLLKKRKLIFYALMTYGIFILLGIWTNSQRGTTFNSLQNEFYISFINTPQIDGDLLKSTVDTNKNEKLVLNYKIKSLDEKKLLSKRIKIGLACKVKGDLTKPDRNRNEGLFNYKLSLNRQNIYWKLKVESFSACNYEKGGLVTQLNKFREKGMMNIEKIYSKPLIPYAKALLFGDSSDFTEETYTLYQRLGIVHLLAISGLHVGLIMAGLFFFLIRMGFTREYSGYCLLVVLPVYAILSGGNPPVIRAVIMSMILLSSKQWKLPFTSLDALSISFMFFSFIDPYIVYNVGFQLSFVVSLSILFSTKTIIPRYHSFLTQTISISFISQLASLPILAFSFYEISIISIISNIMFIPFYSFILLPAFLISFAISFISLNVFSFIETILRYTIKISENLGQLLDFNWAVLVIGKPGIWFLVFIIISAFLTLILWELGKTWYKAILPIVFSITTVIACQIYNPFGEVTFIDVGQGDSILIRLPLNRGTYLIDTGGQIDYEQPGWKKRENPFQIGEDILLPLFKSKGIRTIDKLILTHGDADHIGAAKEIIGNIPIKQIMISPHSWEKPVMLYTLEKALKYKIPVKEVKSGLNWRTKSGSFQFIYPFDQDYEGNNDSLVTLAEMGGKKWLFTGDVEKQGEGEIMKYYSFTTDVIKVAHHGSKTSSSKDFFEQIQPGYAIISAGKNNQFGHPHKEVLDVLEENNVKIYRTDQNGAIIYKFFRNNGTFRMVLP